MLKPLGLTACLLLASRGSAADMEDFDIVITGLLAIGYGWGSGVSVPFSLRGFDPDWGTLRAVWLEATIWLQGDVLFTNPADYPATARANLRYFANISGVDFWQPVLEWIFVQGETIEPGDLQVVHFSAQAWNDTSGPGRFLPSFVPVACPVVSTPGTSSRSIFRSIPEITAQVNVARVRVSYYYTPGHHPIPEPTTALLLSAGAALLAARRLRTKRA
jgi:hypothetical protein